MKLTSLLHVLGKNARFILAIGCIAALFLPQLSAFIRPALPALVSMVLGLSMARLDLAKMAKDAARPKSLLRAIGFAILIVPVTALIYAAIARGLGLSETDYASLVLLAAAPPIASAAGLCFLLGFNARLALETTLITTILTPLLGPLIVVFLLPDAAPISPFLLAQRLALMIAGGLALGIGIRAVFGADRIDRNKLSFDGIAACGMVLFVIPLFDGVGATILDNPINAVWVLFLSFLFNIGINLLASGAARLKLPQEDAGTLGIVWGNRTVAIYLAALPQDPQFALFVALYQFPMYLTPLIWGLRPIRAAKG